jgi:RNA polymerase sigma factor (sigma-70 family)
VGPASDPRDAYQAYGPALVRKAERILRSRDDATDVVHGLFVDLISRRATSVDLPYLYRAVTNRCLNFVRDESNRARLLEREAAAVAPRARVRCDDVVIGTQLLARLAAKLDDGHLDVLVCRFFDDMTQDEIGEQLGLSRKTIGKRLARIRDEVIALGVSAVAGGAS